MAIPEVYRSVVVGSGPAGAGAAHFFNPDMVLYTAGESSAGQSNECWRHAFHPDNPAVWSRLVAETHQLLRLAEPDTEATNYLIQVHQDKLPQAQRQVERILTSTHLPVGMKFDHPPIILWDSNDLAAARSGKHSFIPQSWQNAINTVGGKIPDGMVRLDALIPETTERKNSRVKCIRAGEIGKLILDVESTAGNTKVNTEEAVIAIGPFISGIDWSQVALEMPYTTPEDLLLPDKIELPPGKIQVQSLINLEFSDKLIDALVLLTVLRLTDDLERKDVLASGIITEKDLKDAGDDEDKITQRIKSNLVQFLLRYGMNGLLLQNLDKVYMTRTNPVFATQAQSRKGFNFRNFVREGTWRHVMIGRESHEEGDMNEFPPSGKPSDNRAEILRANNTRRDHIINDAKGLMPPVDALVGALEFIKSGRADDLASYNFKDLFIRHMPVQSGFYHVTTGIEVDAENSAQYQKLLFKYHEPLNPDDKASRLENTRRLERAGIDPKMIIRDRQLCKYKHPFAVWSIDNTNKRTGKTIIPDVDLPYMDTVRINGALVSVIGWLRGRGFMAGPGAARLLYEKHRLIKENKFDPEDDFGKYMQQFSIVRMYQPELMDRLLEEKILGGTGDI